MNDDSKECAATPAATLEAQVMSESVPKSEREWWAKSEIERLRKLELENINLMRTIGYICVECGDNDGEVMIRNSTLQTYDRFTITRTDLPRGGVLIRATPE